jgi:AraC-like DNA-binding protein/mannose-6-phosphate isomerase-like protein (cupin superfamily)
MKPITRAYNEENVLRVQSDSEAGIRLDLVGYVDFPMGHRGAAHAHPFWEVVYVGAGRGEMVREGVAHACNQEDILLIHPGEMHQVCSHENESLQQYFFGFTFDYTPVDSLAWSAPRSLPHGPLLDLIRSDLRQCHNLVRNQKDKEALEISRSLLMPVVSRIVGYLVAPARKRDAHLHARRNSPVQSAKEFLQANMRSHDTVRELAERFGLSPQYFGELFKKETGLTVKEYQTKVRAHRAMELLRDSDLKITDIAPEVGREDLAYFSRVFKKQYQLSPRQLRQQGQLPDPAYATP